MNETRDSIEQWQPCEGGEIHEVVNRFRTRRKRQYVTTLVGTAALIGFLLLAAGITHQRLLGPVQNNFGGITCSDVKENVQGYLAGSLEPNLNRKIEAHLEKCPHCDELYKQMTANPTARLRRYHSSEDALVAQVVPTSKGDNRRTSKRSSLH